MGMKWLKNRPTRKSRINHSRSALAIVSNSTGRNINYLSNATYDRVSIFNHPVTVSELLNPAETLKKSAALWLEMDKETVTGEYYSMGIGGRTYGMIWPDRSAQPELWQLKKSAQPIKIEMTDPQSRTIGLTNRFGFTNLNQYDLVWAVKANGASIESANMSVDLAPEKRHR